MVEYRLGKKAPKFDKRTFKLSSILKATVELPPVPDEFDVDKSHNTTMTYDGFGNDLWGDCVIAGRANMTMRFEYDSQKYQIPITTEEVLNEYWKEQGAWVDNWFIRLLYRIFHAFPDNGLVMLDSLNKWREKGWKAGGKDYSIHAFAALNPKSVDDLKQAVYFLNGAYIGFSVTQTAMNQFNVGEMWNLIYDDNIIGGHAVYIVGYNKTGPICITWGKRQQMTWEFYKKYCDEAYAVVDERNNWQADDPIDCEKLEQLLKGIA